MGPRRIAGSAGILGDDRAGATSSSGAGLALQLHECVASHSDTQEKVKDLICMDFYPFPSAVQGRRCWTPACGFRVSHQDHKGRREFTMTVAGP